jgi:16S rRNA (guanine527-N7)-methyltransferase
LGSGAGLPGIPLKIMRDDIKLYLIESTQKKAAFLSLVTAEMNLKNVTVLPERAENITDIKCDVVLIRLIGKIKKTVPMTVSLLKSSGKIIFYKSKNIEEEISEAKKILAKYKLRPAIKEITLPETKIARRLVILER